MPLYFADEELPLFSAFLDNDVVKGNYDMIFSNQEPVACGGIALNQPNEFTKEEHVVLTWGMVHSAFHKQGFGKQLLEHRLHEAYRIYPGVKVALGTTQHTFRFFEKYGFKTVFFKSNHWAKGLDLYQMELSFTN
jgi:predicted GNAT family N-acyltransferase